MLLSCPVEKCSFFRGGTEQLSSQTNSHQTTKNLGSHTGAATEMCPGYESICGYYFAFTTRRLNFIISFTYNEEEIKSKLIY